MKAAAPAHGLLNVMPDDVFALIISLTSPTDAARSSFVFRNIRTAAVSDAVWGQFLPPDIDAILSRAVDPVKFFSKKDLFRHLSIRSVLIDEGHTSFSLERSSGKTCLMLSARKLWGNNAKYWTFAPDPESRFGEVAELRGVGRFDFGAEIATTSLSPRATYGAFLVFKPRGHAAWFRSPAKEARSREDGWMEIEMERFLNDHEDPSVRVRFHQLPAMIRMGGLIVQGIEFKPVISELAETSGAG